MVKLVCPECGKEFDRRIYDCFLKNGTSFNACSDSCRGKISRKIQMGIFVDLSKNLKEVYEVKKELKRNLCLDKTLGYLYIYDPKHPLANASGKVYAHRIVASKKIGRWITSKEHVHHINGNKKDNNPENLMILSASDHAKMEAEERGWEVGGEHFCKKCNKSLSGKTKTSLCGSCERNGRRKFDPTKKELSKMIWKMPMTEVGEFYGVTGVAVAKRCNIMGIEKPPTGYWLRKK